MDMTMSSATPNRVEVVTAMRRIKQLEGALGRKTLENEILKGAGQQH